MIRYTLNHAIVGVQRSPAGMRIIQIASGEVLDLPELEKNTGLVDIVHGGRNTSVSVKDVVEHGELIDRK